MRTVFVNPRRRRKKTTRRRRRTPRSASMPRRRRRHRRRPTSRHAAPRRRRRTYRRRRRNAGIAPFVSQQNPLILSNPRRRRARRRNPKLNLKHIMQNLLTYVGGGALGYGVNQFGLSQIPNDWLRRGAQAGTAVVGAYFMRGELGAAFAGATMYPLIADLAMFTGLVAVPTSAELDELSADLEAALEADLGDDELYIDDFEPAQDEQLVAW